MNFIVIKKSKCGKPISAKVTEASTWSEAVKEAQRQNLVDKEFYYIPLQRKEVKKN